MLKKVLIGIGALLVVLVAVIATRPEASHIERSTEVQASPEVLSTLVADFHNFATWSPWDKLDPTMKKSFKGPASGVGAIYEWVGNDKVGEGRMTITDVKPEKIGLKLEFMKPWEATNAVAFTFAAAGPKTKVTWSMDGHNNFGAKAASLFMDMDKMVGGDFERGLASLKTAAEAETARRAAEAAKAQAAAAPAEAAPAEGAAQPAPKP
jgi:hypothetical protein